MGQGSFGGRVLGKSEEPVCQICFGGQVLGKSEEPVYQICFGGQVFCKMHKTCPTNFYRQLFQFIYP